MSSWIIEELNTKIGKATFDTLHAVKQHTRDAKLTSYYVSSLKTITLDVTKREFFSRHLKDFQTAPKPDVIKTLSVVEFDYNKMYKLARYVDQIFIDGYKSYIRMNGFLFDSCNDAAEYLYPASSSEFKHIGDSNSYCIKPDDLSMDPRFCQLVTEKSIPTDIVDVKFRERNVIVYNSETDQYALLVSI